MIAATMRGATLMGVAILLSLGCGSSGGGGTGDAGTGTGTGTGGDGATSADGSGGSDGTGDATGVSVGPESVFVLQLSEAPPAVTLQLDKAEVAALFADQAAEITLRELDSTAVLTDAVDATRDACGTAWQFDNPDPNPDCSLTPLGQTFAGPDGTWQTSPEYAMVRLLTMTPANVDVAGTSSEGLQDLAAALAPIIDDAAQVLADMLGIARTGTLLTTSALVSSLRDEFLASHPAVGAGGMLAVTLADAVGDLGPMSTRYGPQGDHPGILDPTAPAEGELFGPAFSMVAVADSNLVPVDGVDADGAGDGPDQGSATVVVDLTGPTFDEAYELDFDDPARFDLEDVADSLAVDLRFVLGELPQFVPACTGSSMCHDNLPGAPTSAQSVWSLDRWQIEYVMTSAAHLDFGSLTAALVYLLGTAEVDVGQGGNPPGWIQYDVFLGLGNPPEDQYVWEMIMEIGQVRLHDAGLMTFPEGVQVVLPAQDVDVGVSAAAVADALRPHMPEHVDELSQMLGGGAGGGDPVDFYYRRAEDGGAWVYFAAPGDRPEGAGYDYATPGFFVDADLGDKASQTMVEGIADTAHEKLAPPMGESVYYFADDTGARFRVRFVVDGDEASLEVGVAPVL